MPSCTPLYNASGFVCVALCAVSAVAAAADGGRVRARGVAAASLVPPFGCPWGGGRPRDVEAVAQADVANILAVDAAGRPPVAIAAAGWGPGGAVPAPGTAALPALHVTPYTTLSNVSLECGCDAPHGWCTLHTSGAAAAAYAAAPDLLPEGTGGTVHEGVAVTPSSEVAAGFHLAAAVFTEGRSVEVRFHSAFPSPTACWLRARAVEGGREDGPWCGAAVAVAPVLPPVPAAAVSPRNGSFTTVYERLPLQVGGYRPHDALFGGGGGAHAGGAAGKVLLDLLLASSHAAGVAAAWRGLLARLELRVKVVTYPTRAAAAAAGDRYLPDGAARWVVHRGGVNVNRSAAIAPPAPLLVGSWTELLLTVADVRGEVLSAPPARITYTAAPTARLLRHSDRRNATVVHVVPAPDGVDAAAATASTVLMWVTIGLAVLWVAVVAAWLVAVVYRSAARHRELAAQKLRRRKWVTVPAPDAADVYESDVETDGTEEAVYGPQSAEDVTRLLHLAAATPLREDADTDGSSSSSSSGSGSRAGKGGGGSSGAVTFAPDFGDVWYMSEGDVAMGRSLQACQACHARTMELHRVGCEASGEYMWVCPPCVSAIASAPME